MALNTDISEKLTEEIHAKCTSLNYSPDEDKTLANLIVNLLKLERSEQEINTELRELVDSYDVNLTRWIVERRLELERPQEEAMDTDSKVPRLQRENRMFALSLREVQQDRHAPLRNRAPRRNERSRSRSPDQRSYQPARHESRSGRYREHSHDRDRDDRRHVSSRLGRRRASIDEQSQDRPSILDRLGGSKPKRERCTYWPACNNGDNCNYFHPHSPCPDYPNCRNSAKECMFIHPQEQPQKPFLVSVNNTTPCKFYPNCGNPACPFVHPGPREAPKRILVPCRDGENCTRPGCHFMHGPMNLIPCKFGESCSRPGCFYDHSIPPLDNKSLALNTPQELKNIRQFSVPDSEIEERITLGESADLIKRTSSSQQNNENTTMGL